MIPKGFQLRIHSWENDADHPGVETLDGLSKEDVKFYLDLLPLFDSQGASNGEGYGNGIDSDFVKVGKDVLEVYLRHPNVSKTVKDSFEWLKEVKEADEDEYVLSDGLREVIGDLLGCSEFYDFRVFDHAEVFEFKTAVANVTSKFKPKKGKG